MAVLTAVVCLVGVTVTGSKEACGQVGYTITALNVNTFEEWLDINSAGQVVGTSEGSPDRGFLWSSGVLTDLGTLGLSGGGSRATGMNNNGQIVGQSTVPGGSTGYTSGAFLWENGAMTEVIPGAPKNFAQDINDAGEITGWMYLHSGSGLPHAFVKTDGNVVDLGTLGGEQSRAFAINSSGKAVGYTTTSSPGIEHAFIWEDGVMTDLGAHGGVGPAAESLAYDINETDQVVGFSYTSVENPQGSHHAFLWDHGEMTDLGVLPGGQVSQAYGINNNGQIVGWSSTAEWSDQAFLWENGTMYDLNTLVDLGDEWRFLRKAYAINDNGQIVGMGQRTSGSNQAFLLTVIPEPATLSLLVLGAWVGLFRRRKQAGDAGSWHRSVVSRR